MSKVLVAFFSASGVTRRVAGNLADVIGADLHEIVPAVLYTKADLNWMNRKSRSSVEMKDRACRPEISSETSIDISQYDVIFVGFPIWWYREPSIIDTFMEAHDFSGKTVIPFATSGTSGLGDSAKNLKELAPGAEVLEGKRLPAKITRDKLKEWAAGYGI